MGQDRDGEMGEVGRFLDQLDGGKPLPPAPSLLRQAQDAALAERGSERAAFGLGETSPPDPLSPSASSGQALLGRGGESANEEGRGGASAAGEGRGEKRRGAGRGRRRVHRWGEAARKAAQSEIADGDKAPLRSLRAVREAFPMSQEELAERARLSRSTIAGLEAGGRRALPKTRRVIARVLGELPGAIAWG